MDKDIYFGAWSPTRTYNYPNKRSRALLEKDFDITNDPEVNILFANYQEEGYEGYAFVLFEKGGKLYEVHGSHCSCYGLEDQWDPEEVVMDELKQRVTNEDNFTFRNMQGKAKFNLFKFIIGREANG